MHRRDRLVEIMATTQLFIDTKEMDGKTKLHYNDYLNVSKGL